MHHLYSLYNSVIWRALTEGRTSAREVRGRMSFQCSYMMRKRLSQIPCCDIISIPPPPTEGNGNSEETGVKKEAISEVVGVAFRGVFSGAPGKIGELLESNRCSC